MPPTMPPTSAPLSLDDGIAAVTAAVLVARALALAGDDVAVEDGAIVEGGKVSTVAFVIAATIVDLVDDGAVAVDVVIMSERLRGRNSTRSRKSTLFGVKSPPSVKDDDERTDESGGNACATLLVLFDAKMLI